MPTFIIELRIVDGTDTLKTHYEELTGMIEHYQIIFNRVCFYQIHPKKFDDYELFSKEELEKLRGKK